MMVSVVGGSQPSNRKFSTSARLSVDYDKATLWQRFVSTTCVPGFKHYRQAKCVRGRLFWGFVISASVTIATVANLRLVGEYLTYTTYTSVAEEINPDGMSFPPVAVCFHYRTTVARVKQVGLKHLDELNYVYHSFYSHTSTLRFITNRSLEIIQEVERMITNRSSVLSEISIDSLIAQLTPSCDDLVEDCVFGPLNEVRNCCGPGSLVDMGVNGPCLSLGMLPSYTQRTASTAGGVRIVLRTPNATEYPTSNFYAYPAMGVSIYQSPFMAHMQRGGNLVGPNQVAQLLYSAVRTETQSREAQPCNSVPRGMKGSLSRDTCSFLCLASKMNSSCGCVGYSTQLQKEGYVTCSATQALECHLKISKNVTASEKTMVSCHQSCPFRCVDTVHHVSLSYTPLMTSPYGGGDNRVVLLLSYPLLKTLVFREVHNDNWFNLVSQVGGTYGLFIGGFLVGLIHLVYLNVEVLIELMGRLAVICHQRLNKVEMYITVISLRKVY